MDQNHLQFAPRGFYVVKTRNNSPLFQLLIKSRSGSDWEESLNLCGLKTKDLTLQALLLLCCCSFDGTEETCNQSSRHLWSPNMIYQLFLWDQPSCSPECVSCLPTPCPAEQCRAVWFFFCHLLFSSPPASSKDSARWENKASKKFKLHRYKKDVLTALEN